MSLARESDPPPCFFAVTGFSLFCFDVLNVDWKKEKGMIGHAAAAKKSPNVFFVSEVRSPSRDWLIRGSEIGGTPLPVALIVPDFRISAVPKPLPLLNPSNFVPKTGFQMERRSRLAHTR